MIFSPNLDPRIRSHLRTAFWNGHLSSIAKDCGVSGGTQALLDIMNNRRSLNIQDRGLLALTLELAK